MNEFADIALAKFLQMLPELGAYIVTFQDVTEELNDDSGMQIGIFVLKPGAELLYIPVIAKNANVYPIDSVFFTGTGKFFPLSRKTVSAVLSGLGNDQSALGKSTKIPETVNTNPSVYELINPPRTGKFVYASQSRLTEFLAALPAHIKEKTFEKLSAEKSVYDNLDELFGLQAIFDVLKARPEGLASVTNHAPISIATAGDRALGLGEVQVNNILNDGYHVMGAQPSRRIAVMAENYNADGLFKQVSDVDGGKDYEVAMANGTSREAFIPTMMGNGSSSIPLAVFTNGDFALSKSFIAVGEELNRRDVLKTLFEVSPPQLIRDIYMGDVFTVMLADGQFIGPYRAANVVMSSLGAELKVYNLSTGKVDFIYAYRNFKGSYDRVNHDVYVPSNCIVIKLKNDVSLDIEVSPVSAHKKRELNQVGLLGDELNIGYDGIEFSVNGAPLGKEASVMKRLVVDEGIDPELAKNFVKEAKLTKFTKVYMTKKAYSTDTNMAVTPQYGEVPDDQSKNVGMNGAFLPNVADSLEVGDAQTTEATIISELLQVPDIMVEVGEYLPDIEEAIDKLGRILFMARVHIDRLADVNDADGVFAFLASIRTVYQNLGQNYLKLQSMVATSHAVGETVGAGVN
jgi:hypothetical protein